uniref:DM13 domain-containing protein n=1 Tax=Glossina pallidipes TaxID=7398 RepID=A0A1A9ZWW8_GLOPL
MKACASTTSSYSFLVQFQKFFNDEKERRQKYATEAGVASKLLTQTHFTMSTRLRPESSTIVITWLKKQIVSLDQHRPTSLPPADCTTTVEEVESDPPILKAHNNTDIILRLPMGKRIKDIRWLSVWCRRFTKALWTKETAE